MNDGKELSKSFLKDISQRHSVIIGMTRSGKTYLCKHILEELHNMNVHTVFFDPKHDDDFASLGTICRTPMQFYAQLIAKNPRIVYRPPGTKEGRQQHLTEIIDLVFNAQRNKRFKNIRRVIAIDEIQLMVKKGGHDGIERLWTVGAGQGIVGLAITQRVQLLNETVWSQSENKLLFKVEDRPEYLRSRNLDHYAELLPYFQAPENRYWFYATVGDGVWKKHPPVGQETKKTGRPNNMKRLRLSRWQS